MNESLTWSQMKYKRFIDASGGWERFQNLLRTLLPIAQKHGVGIATLASHYMLLQPAVAGVIIGARLGKSEHLAENEGLFSIQLDEADRASIQTALNSLQKIPGDCGDEYRKAPFLTASGDLSHHIDGLPSPYPTQEGSDGRTKALSGTIWEDIAGFSRAVRKGNHILVSGTTATHGSVQMGGDDPAAQMHFIIDKVEGAIRSLGGSLEDVVRTRIFVQRASDWEAISRAHGQRFAGIQPANTLVQATLIGDGYLVEMETDALLS